MNQTKIPVLPVDAYTTQAFFDLEQEKIFGNTWQFAGFVEDLKDPGDFVTVQAGLSNLMVVRGRDQRLRCFHNMCRHRGTQLLRAIGKKQKAITCPYHDWTYSLTGELTSIPDKETQFPDVDMKKLCLHKASVETWCGMVFVHPNPDPQSFAEYFDGVDEHLGPHRPEELVEYEGTRTEHVIKANWKIVAENYIDIYHLAHLHSATLNMYAHDKAEWRFVGPHYMFYEPFSEEYGKNVENMSPLPLIDHVPVEQRGAYVPLLFPNLGLAETEATWSIFHIIPVAPDETRVVTRTKMMPMSSWEFTKQSWKSALSWHGGMRTKYGDAYDPNDPLTSGDFMAEDVLVCEQQQKSLKSPLMSVGASAKTTEASVRMFQQIVGERVGL